MGTVVDPAIFDYGLWTTDCVEQTSNFRFFIAPAVPNHWLPAVANDQKFADQPPSFTSTILWHSQSGKVVNALDVRSTAIKIFRQFALYEFILNSTY